MNKYEEKLNGLLAERETLIAEIAELEKAIQNREQRLIQISGSVITLQEIIEDSKDDNTEENEKTTNKK